MPRFFSDDIKSNKIKLNQEDTDHIKKSLRMKEGDIVIISDGKGTDYDCSLSFDKINNECYGDILNKRNNKSEIDISITLYQAIPKTDKMEFIIQKATELGVNKIVPVITQYCVKRPNKEKQKKLCKRYNKIAKEAAKQSGRGKVPIVENIIDYKNAVKAMKDEDKSLLFYEVSGEKIETMNFKNFKNIGVMIGSEGGFTEDEVLFASHQGITVANLGKRILRCETASIVALTILLINTNNF